MALKNSSRRTPPYQHPSTPVHLKRGPDSIRPRCLKPGISSDHFSPQGFVPLGFAWGKGIQSPAIFTQLASRFPLLQVKAAPVLFLGGTKRFGPWIAIKAKRERAKAATNPTNPLWHLAVPGLSLRFDLSIIAIALKLKVRHEEICFNSCPGLGCSSIPLTPSFVCSTHLGVVQNCFSWSHFSPTSGTRSFWRVREP